MIRNFKVLILFVTFAISPALAHVDLLTQDLDFVFNYLTAVKHAHEHALQAIWTIERQKNNQKKQAHWQKKQDFSTDSLPEFMCIAEEVQREHGCKIDVQQNSKRLPDQSEHIAQIDKVGNIAIIDQNTSKKLYQLKHIAQAQSAIFSHCGTYLAIADQKSIKILDSTSYRIIYEIFTGDAVSKVTFSPNGAFLACMTKTGKVQIYNSVTGELVSRFDNGAPAHLFAFSKDNKYMILRSDLWRKQQDTQDPYRLTVWEYNK